MITRIDHIDLRVSDVNAFIEQFEKLGFQVIGRIIRPDKDKAQLALPGENQVVLDVTKIKPGEPLGVKHIGLAIDNPATVEELAEKGFEILRPHRNAGASDRKLSNFMDIDDHVWQLCE